MKLQEMTMEELVAAEKATVIVRKKYENEKALGEPDKLLDPTVVGFVLNTMESEEKRKLFERHKELSTKLARINAIHLAILQEMEERLITIE